MPYTNNAQAELQAVNEILASIGQAPVTTIEAQTITYEDGTSAEIPINPEVAIVYETLTQVSREVQAEGWTFNKENEYPITPDSNGHLSMTGSMLQMDLSDTVANSTFDTVIRSGRLYDRWSGRVYGMWSGRVYDRWSGRGYDRWSDRVYDMWSGRWYGRWSGRGDDR